MGEAVRRKLAELLNPKHFSTKGDEKLGNLDQLKFSPVLIQKTNNGDGKNRKDLQRCLL
ncbi:hypothetical protein ALC57_13532 [Trachymyrmex cornetzi]|uniref:Uncharacterized protein n=1 Tax=Trachymyrmex cornetzi TaxID=471704 RepID=A0A195DN85_9HYME|nr:hypothetical protein ALC57_13532 [Trachymyrmex cornetzi]